MSPTLYLHLTEERSFRSDKTRYGPFYTREQCVTVATPILERICQSRAEEMLGKLTEQGACGNDWCFISINDTKLRGYKANNP